MEENVRPPFHALNGHEMVEFILTRVKEKLEKSGEFPGHITFPLFKLKVDISLNSYPQQGLDDDPKIKVHVDEAHGQGTQTEPPVVVSLQHEEVVNTPNKAREAANLPVPVPAINPQGQIMDVPRRTGVPKK